MKSNTYYDAVIIGGSYAGLSAAMSLGRALRNVLVIDSGLPCNRQTPHSHNFLTQDGRKPKEIADMALAQIHQYKTVRFYKGMAINATQSENIFVVETENGETFSARKLIFATGIKDTMPAIKGFAECWGISVIHCPYCHGYEVRQQKTGILANGEGALHYARLINQWTSDLTLFTNGPSTLTEEQTAKLTKHNIAIIETPVSEIIHTNGQLEALAFEDDTLTGLSAIYYRPAFVQHCPLPEKLGCELNEHGLIKISGFQKTNVPGVFACGDNSHSGRSVAMAVSSGSMTGAFVNHELIEEDF
ncbi:NAD(P)/FAD-dependent oxidoreductase [Emticicia sp. 21SJ11W-3]|uniref:NAD(P)/FAD-dependent oxidoreductase n=1 Tax=Emticicia sp. 21SJ11W-3 TaxID=2916755 RepID=UPI00209D9DBF|nr:NAD(P)/FAD-dependent oxidoreductase [Emticicia sp. 21SJ11W-3]UTA67716.1 NAD(P)/FAD-dependent oxidoreductase [Emticicia sp. 21SJ11W-3]